MSQNNVVSLDCVEDTHKSYYIFLSSGNKIIKTISDISPYCNLSEYIKIFVNDIKDNTIRIPNFVDEVSMNIIIDFIEIYSNTNQYKINEVSNDFNINIVKPVRSDEKLRDQIGTDNYNYINNIISRRIFKKILNAAMCLNIPILIEMICAKIAIDIKYLTKVEIENYFRDS